MRSITPLTISALVAVCTAVAACGGGNSGDQQRGSGHVSGAAGPYRSLDITVKITPSKAGTAEQPQGVRLDLAVKVGARKDVEPPQVDGIDLDFPPGSAYGGDQVPACPKTTLDTRGPDGCPPGSVTGSGTLIAYADTARSPGRITVVNGGKDSLYFWTELDHPARVQAAAVGTITPADGGGYRLALAIPDKLQVVAGVPISLRELRVSAESGTWLATTGCPDGHWTFYGSARFNDGSSLARDTEVGCD